MPADRRDLYDTLGVSRDAKPAEIRAAYRKRAAKLHPDAHGSEEDFKDLANAHAVLSDPEKRRQYDETGTVKSAAGEDDEALKLIWDLAAQAIAVDPRCNVLGAIRQQISQSKAGAIKRLAELKIAGDNVEKNWFGGEAAKQTILIGLTRTASQIEGRQKLYARVDQMLDDASFRFSSPEDELLDRFMKRHRVDSSL